MVSSVSTVTSATYYSYLNQLQGGTGSTTSSTTNNASGIDTSSTDASQSLVSSLLSGTNAFTPAALSLLQENSSGGFDPISSLLGGASSYNPLTSLYANLYASTVASSLTQAQANGEQQAAAQTPLVDSVQNLINGQTQASVAYNKTNQQNAQAVIKANSYGPDGVTALVA